MTGKRFTTNGCYINDTYHDGRKWLVNEKGVELTAREVVDIFIEQQSKIKELVGEVKLLKPTNIEQYEQIRKLQEENDTLKAYIDTIFEGNTHICKELDIENARFHCSHIKGYKEPTCTYMTCFDCDELIPVNQKIDEIINGEKLRYSIDKSVYELYDYDKPMRFEEVVDRLNNQDKTIRMLKEKNSKKMLGEPKPFYCRGTTIYVDENGDITSEARKK